MFRSVNIIPSPICAILGVMMRLSYKKLRPYILTTIIVGLVIVMGFWAYKEFASPEPTANRVAINVKNETPSAATPSQTAEAIIPPLHPKRLKIPAINVDASVLPMSLTKEGLVDAPKTARETGWFNESALPGSGKGTVFIDGHVNDSLSSPGVFYRLAELTKGSDVTLVRGDDMHITYKIEEIVRQPLDQVNMGTLLSSVDPGREGLTLITCGGVYDKEQATFTERVVVRGTRQ